MNGAPFGMMSYYDMISHELSNWDESIALYKKYIQMHDVPINYGVCFIDTTQDPDGNRRFEYCFIWFGAGNWTVLMRECECNTGREVRQQESLRSRNVVSRESLELINNTADVNNGSPVIRELVQANNCHAPAFITICFTWVLDWWPSVYMNLIEYSYISEIPFICHHWYLQIF